MTAKPGGELASATSEIAPETGVVDEGTVLQRLSEWPISGIGLHPGGSNYVFVVRLSDPQFFNAAQASDDPPEVDEESSMYAIYKPQAGERPLRDFPAGTLHYRERAAYLVSRELGWPLIPPTVVRAGPHGEGSVQLFIDAADSNANYFSLREQRLDDFRDMAMFDVLVHNADRKGGSCIVSEDKRIWSIDHGLTFNRFARRRTVMFEFNGTEYPQDLLADVQSMVRSIESEGGSNSELQNLLQGSELDDLVTRANDMIEFGHYPVLDPDTNVPWPMV